jgi:HlyD family secretion protein
MRRNAWMALMLPALLLAVSCGRNGKDRIVASGHVEATEVRVASETGGTVRTLAIAEGDVVARGQVLATLDSVDKHLELAQARADRDIATAQLRLFENGARREDVAAARARLESAAADLKGAETDLQRMEALEKTGAASRKALDDARTRRDVSAAAAKAAREELKRLEAGSRVEDIQAARARLASQDARMARLEEDLRDLTIESPEAGIISDKLVEVGEIISPGTPVAVVTNLADAWLTAFIAETDLGRIRLGQVAEVVTDDGQRRNGRVTFISPRAEFTPRNVQTRDERVKLVYEIKVSLDNRDGLFKPGMPAEAVLVSGAPVDSSAVGQRP